VRCKGGVCGFAADSGAMIATLPHANWPDGARAKVYQLRETFVMSTDATGMAPAVPDGAPEVEGDRVLIKDFGEVRGFRVY
jgi:hypothetical protein